MSEKIKKMSGERDSPDEETIMVKISNSTLPGCDEGRKPVIHMIDAAVGTNTANLESNNTNACSYIKASLSMTALSPNEQQDGNEIAKANLQMERAYHSLKKKRNSDRESWRNSWGSGHSHSSCSLHSNATGIVGLSSGKDDFWAALQSNYNYIMDTHLLDTCIEARGEIENPTSVSRHIPECEQNEDKNQEDLEENPRALRKWLREMENNLSNSPSLFEAAKFSLSELQERLAKHSVLYCEIASHGRVVGACVRASEKDKSSVDNLFIPTSSVQNPPLNEENTPVESFPVNTSGYNKKIDCNLKGLERRYHLLYLKAIEIQCLLEGVLKRKDPIVNIVNPTTSNEESESTDTEPVAKLARLCYNINSISDNSEFLEKINIKLQETAKQEEINTDKCNRTSKNDTDVLNRDWSDLSFCSTVKSFDKKKCAFDADSESSECEYRGRKCRKKRDKIQTKKSNSEQANKISNSSYLTYDCKIMDSSKSTSSNANLKIKSNNCTQQVVINIAANCNPSNNTQTSQVYASPENTPNTKKRQRNCDTSKFNRSNRKSKNCAIFYFKHLDTDNETNFGRPSQETEELKLVSDVSNSEDHIYEDDDDEEEWLYTNNKFNNDKKIVLTSKSLEHPGEAVSQQFIKDDSDKENKNLPKEQPNSVLKSNFCDNSKHSTVSNSDLKCEPTEIRQPQHPDTASLESNVEQLCIINADKKDVEMSPVKKIEELVQKFGMRTNSAYNDKLDEKIILIADAHFSNKEECSNESIKKLVLGADRLIRSEIIKKAKEPQAIFTNTLFLVEKENTCTDEPANIQKVQAWLEHQPLSPKQVPESTISTTDCEASGEYTDSDSPAACQTDSSEGLTDSVATCKKVGGSTSNFTSTEVISGSEVNQVPRIGSNPNLNSKVMRRYPNRRNSERPWSVSCLSQLTESNGVTRGKNKEYPAKGGLASHSISESALNKLSSPVRANIKQSANISMKNSDGKNSLKRRKIRKKKLTGKVSDSGSEKFNFYDVPMFTKGAIKRDSISAEQITKTCDFIGPITSLHTNNIPGDMESEEDQAQLMKPNFKVGSYTKPYIANESKLGSLAALSNYMKSDGECTTTDEHNSNFSEQAWDNYQEKYNSENYSEGLDSDAARRLLEFGDDYRNFLDSQSDNNLDSMSPPRVDSLKQPGATLIVNKPQITTISVGHIHGHGIETDLESASKTLKMKKNIFEGNIPKTKTALNTDPVESRSAVRKKFDSVNRKLDFTGITQAKSIAKRTYENEPSLQRKIPFDEQLTCTAARRRTLRVQEKFIKAKPPVLLNNDDTRKDMDNLLQQSKKRLENMNALKFRSHLLRPEDYAEIITTCYENIKCLEAVIRGQPGINMLPLQFPDIQDLLNSWESLLEWSENAGIARNTQAEIKQLKKVLERLGEKLEYEFESESSIRILIEKLKIEQTDLQQYRSQMLNLNVSVHSWLTRQETRLKQESTNEQIIIDGSNLKTALSKIVLENTNLEINNLNQLECELHKHLKNEVSEMYSAWDNADIRIKNDLEALNNSLVTWRQLENGLSEFCHVLGKDRGTLKGLEGALENDKTSSSDLAYKVKQVAKLLSENIENASNQQQFVPQCDSLKFIHLPHFAASNGSLSDSGISDGGATSDGGLSERVRRLGVLRRLAKQLESSVAPGNKALKAIQARMEAAEEELKNLQNTCRDLIVRTAVSQNVNKFESKIIVKNNKGLDVKKSEYSLNEIFQSQRNIAKIQDGLIPMLEVKQADIILDNDFSGSEFGDEVKAKRRGWSWRVARAALPLQLALLTIFCAACFMQPHCCDSINNLAMSFTPHLRYVRGPPPI